MSNSQIIVVESIERGWDVYYQGCIDNCGYGNWKASFETEEGAKAYAHKLEKDMGYVEYGISVVKQMQTIDPELERLIVEEEEMEQRLKQPAMVNLSEVATLVESIRKLVLREWLDDWAKALILKGLVNSLKVSDKAAARKNFNDAIKYLGA